MNKQGYKLNSIHMKILLAALSCVKIVELSANDAISVSNNLFLQRASSANSARELMMEGKIIKTDFDGFYSYFGATAYYQNSWNQDDEKGLGARPFWSGTNTMTIGTNSSNSSLDAYQFGLGDVTTNGSITLNPIVYQGGADFMLFAGSATNDPGVFFKLKASLGVIGIDPQLTEVAATAADNYVPGALSLNTIAQATPATTMTQALAGNLPDGQKKSGDFLPMNFGLLNGAQNSGVKFGDIEMTLGYNVLCNEDHTLGIGLRASGPSGNKPEGIYMLEPIYGRGSSWGVGAYLAGNMKLWENHANKSLTAHLMSNILHLMKSDTVRSYDLTTNGVGSKYLLVADYSANEYQGVIQNLVNLSTLDSESSCSAEGDISLSLSYACNGWSADFGYNFWGRTQEELKISGSFPENRYAILGRQGVGIIDSDPTANSNLCQPTATISSALAAGDVNAVDATVPANRISGNSAFNVEGAQQASCSTSKLFTKLSYAWLESHNSPFVGILGEFEISTSANNAVNQWGVGLVGGIYF